MRNTLPFIISYILSGGLLLAFFLNREKYESVRKFRHLVGQLSSLLLLVVAAAFIVVSCYHVTELTAVYEGWVTIFLIGSTLFLFIGAVIVELNNPPERYSIRRRHIKYALQSMSGGMALLFLADELLQSYSGISAGETVAFTNTYQPLFITMLLIASSEFWWKGGRYLVWAYHNSGALKEGGKDMKELRKSLRR